MGKTIEEEKKMRTMQFTMHLQQNYEMDELYFLLLHYSIIHRFSILFKRY